MPWKKQEDLPLAGEREDSKSSTLENTPKSSLKCHTATEATPLLSSENGTIEDIQSTHRPRRWQTLTYLLMLVIFLVGAADSIAESPTTRVFESVICYRYFESEDPSKIQLGRAAVGPGAIGGVEERYCKADSVQQQLASLAGYQTLFEGFPSLLLAVPFGWLADNYGRKPVLMLGLFSFLLKFLWIQMVTWFWQAFDIRMTWLSALHALLGGGSPVASSLFFVVLSDIVPQDHRASTFLRVGASELAAKVVIPPISASLMTINPWIPSLIGTGLMLICFLTFGIVPETLNYCQPAEHPSTSQPTSSSTETTRHSKPPSSDTQPAHHSAPSTATKRLLHSLHTATAFLTHDSRIPLLILPFIGHSLIAQISQLLLQYTSKRYQLTFSQATLLTTILNAVKVLLLFALLPYASTLAMRHFRLSAQRKDLYLARASQGFVLVGWTLVGLSPNLTCVVISLVVAALGQSTYLLIRSFLTSLVPADQIARVYSIVSLVDTVGAMLGSPLLAGLFGRGLALGGGWVGLPFYFLGVISAGFAVLLFVVRLRKGEESDGDRENDDREREGRE
ncbi:MFS general substrate transporter [Hortaea werneckii]|nr:MFS general substrate transporter [Hortaea werneckii]